MNDYISFKCVDVIIYPCQTSLQIKSGFADHLLVRLREALVFFFNSPSINNILRNQVNPLLPSDRHWRVVQFQRAHDAMMSLWHQNDVASLLRRVSAGVQLCQHWFRQWLTTPNHYLLTNADLSSVRFCSTRLRRSEHTSKMRIENSIFKIASRSPRDQSVMFDLYSFRLTLYKNIQEIRH